MHVKGFEGISNIACRRPEDPVVLCRPNHGVQTMYEFGEDIGGMERSRYFGYSKDLYHRDHFDGRPVWKAQAKSAAPSSE